MLVHGLAEHCGRYMNVVNHFVPLGYAVYGLDHIGHGKSDGTRVYVDRFSDFVDTLKLFVDRVKQWQPGKPCFMIGHSMGGLISAAYLLEYQADLNGAVLSAPAIKVVRRHIVHNPGCRQIGLVVGAQNGCGPIGGRRDQPRSGRGRGLRQRSAGLFRQNHGTPRR